MTKRQMIKEIDDYIAALEDAKAAIMRLAATQERHNKQEDQEEPKEDQ
jgi:hypothetical protein